MSRFFLGLDPGTQLLGHALVEELRPDSFKAVAIGTIIMQPGPLHQRLGQVLALLVPVLERAHDYQAACVVERPFVNKNHMATLAIAGARGVCLALVSAAELPFFEYPPQVWKKVTGNGRAKKPEVAAFVKNMLRLKAPLPFDCSDAAGLAIYHASTS